MSTFLSCRFDIEKFLLNWESINVLLYCPRCLRQTESLAEQNDGGQLSTNGLQKQEKFYRKTMTFLQLFAHTHSLDFSQVMDNEP